MRSTESIASVDCVCVELPMLSGSDISFGDVSNDCFDGSAWGDSSSSEEEFSNISLKKSIGGFFISDEGS